MIRPTAASFLMSENCNLACKYCFELGWHRKINMSKEVIKKGVDFLFENARINNDNEEVHVTLFGGEPLLNLEGVRYLFEYGYECSQKYNIAFTTMTITNGTIMNEEVFNLYSEYRKKISIAVQISVDGVKEAHNMNRVYASNGKGSFDVVEKNFPKWKQIFTNEDSSVSGLCVHGCLSHSNMKYYYESYRYFKDVWKANNIWFMPIHNETYTMDDVITYRKDLQKIAEELIAECIQTNSIRPVTEVAPLDRGIDRVYCGGFSAPCGAGKNFVSITADGKISPCHNIYFNDPDRYTLIGDLDNGIDELKVLIYNRYESNDLSCHKVNPDCDCYACYRCLADNISTSGTFLTQIRKERCMMSHIERDIQHWIHKELAKLGFIENRSGKELN